MSNVESFEDDESDGVVLAHSNWTRVYTWPHGCDCDMLATHDFTYSGLHSHATTSLELSPDPMFKLASATIEVPLEF